MLGHRVTGKRGQLTSATIEVNPGLALVAVIFGPFVIGFADIEPERPQPLDLAAGVTLGREAAFAPWRGHRRAWRDS